METTAFYSTLSVGIVLVVVFLSAGALLFGKKRSVRRVGGWVFYGLFVLSSSSLISDSDLHGQKALLARSLNVGKQIALACREYSIDHDNKWPPDLNALVPTYLPDRAMLVSPIVPGEPVGYTYTPPANNSDPAKIIALEDRFASAKYHRRAVVYANNNSELLNSP